MIFEDCIAPETGKKSDVLMYEIAPHSKEFASFRTKASLVLVPEGAGLSTGRRQVRIYTCKTKCRDGPECTKFL